MNRPTKGWTYLDAFLMCLGVRLAGQSVFREILLGSRHVHDRVLQSPLVRLPLLPCILERTLRICERYSRLFEFLLNVLQGVLKRLLLCL